MTQFGQHPGPSHVVAHLSDPHLLAGGAQLFGVVDTETNLRQALTRLGRITPRPQALIFTGDLADRGEPAAYGRLREIVEPVAAGFDAQVIWTMGNHDERAPYARALFDSDDDGPQDRVYDVAGLRVVALDTSVPGWHHGALEEAQLEWLRGVLAQPAEHGTVLAMHHPPIPVPTEPVAQVIELLDQPRLAAVVSGTDVRAIIGGHFHLTSWSTFAGVPVSVAAASCYTLDPAPDGRLASGVDAHQAFTLLHFYAETVVHTVVPLADGPEVTGNPAHLRNELAKLDPQARLDLVSRKDSPLYAGEPA